MLDTGFFPSDLFVFLFFLLLLAVFSTDYCPSLCSPAPTGVTVPIPNYFSLLRDTDYLKYFLFKFLVIGNAGTGKSCLLHQFIEKKFKDDSNHTIGVEFGSKIINVGGKYVKLQIWDTAGQERFRSVTRSYYRGAAGALLVYDITSRETYNALTNWLTDARMLASQNIVIILCGNKKDLDADREVTFLEASRFAQENELMFLETSALTGENVEEAFVQCARKILNKIESGELDPERMGSGIQYGDAALRQLRSPRRAQAESAQECGC
ncbi:ras-related protein Rab-4A isoform X1 [Rhea pennata]